MGELNEKKVTRRHEAGDCLGLGHALRDMLVSVSLCEKRVAVKPLQGEVDC